MKNVNKGQVKSRLKSQEKCRMLYSEKASGNGSQHVGGWGWGWGGLWAEGVERMKGGRASVLACGRHSANTCWLTA